MGVLALVMGLSGGVAHAATAEGTLLTNTVTITFWSGPLSGQIPYEVSYNSTATVRIIKPVVYLSKVASSGVVSVGGTVTFAVCADNARNDSILNVTMYDVVPNGLMFDHWNVVDTNTSVAPPATTRSWSVSLAGPWNAAEPIGQPGPFYIKWVVPRVDILRQACVTYAAVVQ